MDRSKLRDLPPDPVRRFARAAAAMGAAFLFPPVCMGCRTLVAEPGTLCPSCWRGLQFFERPWCAVLGTPFAHDFGADMVSADAIANPPPFARARSAVAHGGVARQLVHSLKYADRPELARWMAGWMMRAGQELFPDASLVVPVPLHRRRFWTRRYNQSAELGRAVSLRAGIPFEPLAVLRRKPTRQQVGLSGREREDNVRGAFMVPPESSGLVRGRRVLLVDDVYTTGATVSAVTRALLKSGAAAVDVLTFSRVVPGTYTDEANGLYAG